MNTSVLTFLLVVVITLMMSPAVLGSRGAKTYDDSCNLIASGVQFFNTVLNGNENFAEACDLEKGLVCAGNVCKCVPGTVWKQNFLEKIAGLGGQCASSSTCNGAAAGIIMTAIMVLAERFA